MAAPSKFGERRRQIPGVPQDDRRDDEIEAGGAIGLVFERTIAQLAEAVEKDRPRERVARFALVEAETGAPTQLGIAVPAEHEERSFYSADVPQGDRQSVLSWISGQLFQHGRGLDRARSNRRREAKDFAPVGGDVIGVDKPANERSENWRRNRAAEHVVGRPTRIGVMLLDPKAALVVQQAIEDMRRLARGRGNNLGMIRAELIGDMGVERHAWLIAMAGIHIRNRLTMAAGLKI